MKEMSLKEVQQYSLRILEDVHEFCVNNNINYSLTYGTLIGAIRHKGFIPWDDDIDIFMPRPDYERFCKTFKSTKGYGLFSSSNGNAYLNYARVCDLKETYVHSVSWCKESPTGIWIDIFPLDGVGDINNRNEEGKILKKMNEKKTLYRRPKDNLHRPMPFGRRVKTIAKKILLCWTDVERVVKQYDELITQTKFEDSEYCGSKSILTYWEHDFYPKSYFEKFIDVEFEGHYFKATYEFDSFLRRIYGDYMQLPPVEKRVGHTQQRYWR